MKTEVRRRRLANMEVRLQRDLNMLEKMFPHPDWEGAASGTEAIRNLATAIAYVRTFQAMSDPGVEREVEYHQQPHPPI